MNSRLKIFVIFFLFIAGTKSYAQGKLNLEALISLAVKQDFSVQLIEQELKKAQIEQRITKASILPTVSFNNWNGYYDGRYYDPLKNDFFYNPTMVGNMGLTSTWGIYNGGYRNTKLSIDRISITIQYLNLEKKKREISREVINLYSAIVLENNLINIYQKKIDLYAAETARIKELYLLEKVTAVDTSVVALTRIDAEDKQLQLKYKLELDLHQLGLLTNESLVLSDIESNPEFSFDQFNLNESKYSLYDDTTALKNSSISYKIKSLEIEKAHYSTDLQKSQFKPSVKFEAGVNTGYSSNLRHETANMNSEGKYVFFKQFESNRYNSTSLNIYIPVFDRRNKLLERQSRVGENMAKIEEAQTGRKIFIKYSLAKKELGVKYKKLKISQVQVAEINKLLVNYKERFALGRLRVNDLLMAKEKLIEGEMNYNNNYFDFYKALKNFELDYTSNLTY
ncbi:MAG: TolC family protein [Sporocytophaga sp.]|nr:TolC family protein [Sporocytophaga sp.]